MQHLLRPEQQWERTFDSVPDLITILDCDHRIIRANWAMARRLGLSPEQCVGQICYKVVHGLDAPPDFCPHSRLLEDGQEHTIEVHEPRMNGDFLISVTPLSDKSGRVAGSVHVARDITARKRAEEAARRNSRLLGAILDHTHMLVACVDRDFDFVLVNQAYAQADGKSREFFPGKNHFELYPSSENEAVFRQVRDTGRPYFVRAKPFQYAHNPERGVTFWDWSLVPITDAAGEVELLVLTLANVTPVKQAEEALLQSEREQRRQREFLQRLVDHAPLCIAMLQGPELRYVVVNPAYQAIVGPDVQLVGRPYGEFLPEAAQRGVPEVMRRVMETGQPESIREYETPIPGKAQTWWDAEILPLPNEHGVIDSVLVISWEITESMLARKRLEAAKAAAEKAARTAEAANAAKDRFIAVFSHELRTPLTPTLMIAQMHKDDPGLPEELRQDLETICHNVALEARLIDDLIEITQIATSKLLLRRERVDLGRIIREAARSCGDALQAKSHSLTLEIADAPCPVLADASRLHQVFSNLLENAVKFTPPAGSVTVRCARREDSTGTWIRVTVSDTGIGIEPDLLPQIFKPFEQGPRLVVGAFGGFGLGLSIAKAVIEMHGGRISASSDGPGLGAAFTVELPLVAPAD